MPQIPACQQVATYLPLVQKAGPQSPNGRRRLYCEKCGDKSYRARKRERVLEAEQAQDWSACTGLAGSGPMPPVPDDVFVYVPELGRHVLAGELRRCG